VSARRGTLLVLAGPSGVGKGTIGRALRAREPGLRWSVSWATRPPRAGETDGADYHFRSREEFARLRDAGGFLEWFEVFGDLKGTPRAPIEEWLDAGDDVLVEVDVQGALAIERAYPGDALVVFVAPPSPEELRARLEGRGTEDSEALERRLAAAAEEAAAASAQGWPVVVNRDVGSATAEVAARLEARRAAR
jgi:guanylate kinase